jgi:hypothetical protein
MPPLMRPVKVAEKGGVSFSGGKVDRVQTLVVRIERGKPDHLALVDAEIYRFEDGRLVGRLAGGSWTVIAPPGAGEKDEWPRSFTTEDGSTALDRLAAAARHVPTPGVIAARACAAIVAGAEVKEQALESLTRLDASFGGPSAPGEIGEKVRSVAADLRPDGTVDSFVVLISLRTRDASRQVAAAFGHRFRPSALGATTVDVPAEVAALAAK